MIENNRRWFALASLCLALFVISFSSTALNAALTTIANNLRVSLSSLQWAVNIYLLVASAFIVVGGQFGDLYGRRNTLLIGLLAFFIGSALSMVASSGQAINITFGRAIQGFGAALMAPATLSSINTIFLNPREKSVAFAIWGACAGMGSAVGPLLGGVVAHFWGWRSVFWLNLPMIATSAVLAIFALEESRNKDANAKIDFSGLLTLALSIFSLVLALDLGRSEGFRSWPAAGLVLLSGISIWAFISLELKSTSPLIHLSHFKERAFLSANIGVFVVGFALLAVTYQISVFFQNRFALNYTALDAGLALLPVTVPYFLTSLLVAQLTKAFSLRATINAGTVLIGISFGWLSFFSVESNTVELFLPLIGIGIGLGLTMTPTARMALSAMPIAHSGEAAGVTNASRYLGGAFGVAVCSAIYSTISQDKIQKLMAGHNLSAIEFQQIDNILAGVSSQSQSVLDQVPGHQVSSFLFDMKEALFAGFSAAMLTTALLTLIAALFCMFFNRE